MHRFHIAILAIATTFLLTPGAWAQEPVARDTIAARDSAAAEVDTTRTLEEIEAELLGELGAPDTTAGATPAPYAPAGAQGAAGTLNPDISLIADFLADLSPDEATIEGGDRFQLREVELAVQGSVDPYFRYDAFLALHGEGIEVEEGYATTLGLPAGLQVKVGKYRLPFGKVNLTHRPELNTIDYPLLLLEFFGEEGLASTGIWLSAIGAPLGFFQEISVVVTNGAEAHAHEEEEAEQIQAAKAQEEEEAEGKDLVDDLADRLWVAHLKNSWDLTDAANLEVGASWGTSAEDEPERLRTTLYGLDAIWRWKPPALAKYRSAILQTEVAWRTEAGRDLTQLGAFVFGQWQLSRRVYVGARWDYVEPIEAEGPNLQAGQAILRLFPTEFSQIRLTYERQVPEEGDAIDRLLFQTTFALGPHRPHPY